MIVLPSKELYHHGIKGQRWGVRRFQNENGTYTDEGKQRYKVSFGTRHKAKKDAKEFARAKMFYGEGAGNRRKLIKATVNERSKDAGYKQEFDKYLAKQDMADHAAKARRERHVKDAKNSTAKTARGLIHLSTGSFAKASATAVAIYTVAHFTGVDRIVANAAKTKFNDLRNYATSPSTASKVKNFMSKVGLKR